MFDLTYLINNPDTGTTVSQVRTHKSVFLHAPSWTC
jgi:hypothetical protein